MKRSFWLLATGLLVLSFYCESARAVVYDRVLCPPGGGTFKMSDQGLVVVIDQEDGKNVTPHTEIVANPLKGTEAAALIARGRVQFNSHIEKESGHLFVHWETLKSIK